MGKSLMGSVKKNDNYETPKIPHPPKFCQVSKCENETSFVMTKVSSGRGIEHKPASDVMNIERHNGQMFLAMANNYMFVGWFARCPECLMRNIQNKKAKLKMEGEHHYYV